MVTLDIPAPDADPGRLEQVAADLHTLARRLEAQRGATVAAVTGAATEYSEPVASRIRHRGRQHDAEAKPAISGARRAAEVTESWAAVVREYSRRRAALVNLAAQTTWPPTGVGEGSLTERRAAYDRTVRELRGKAESLRDWFEAEARAHGVRLTRACPAAVLRLLNLNIGQGAGNWIGDTRGTDSHEIGRIAQLIIDGGADIATLQEVFRGDVDRLEQELERRTGDRWTIYFGKASTKIQFDSEDRFPPHYIGPFGNAVAVREGGDVLTTETLGEPVPLEGRGAGDGRSLLGVRVHTHQGPLDVYTTHVDEDGEEHDQAQTEQIDRVWQQLGPARPRTVLTGDFNEALDRPRAPVDSSWDALRRHRELGYTDSGGTFPTSGNGTGRRIDYVFTGPGVSAGRATPVDGRPSDHNGNLVDIEVPAQHP